MRSRPSRLGSMWARLLRKKSKEEWAESIEILRGSYFWKEVGCRNDFSTLVGQMIVDAEHVTLEQVSTEEHGKMLKRIRILEDGRVPAKEAKNCKLKHKRGELLGRNFKD